MAEEGRRLAGELRWLDGVGQSPDEADDGEHRTMASLDAHEVVGLARQLLELDGISLGPDNEVRAVGAPAEPPDPLGGAEKAGGSRAQGSGPATGGGRPRRRRP
ncbi:hypothetical protein [Sinomonas sp. ASV322]|uniref:hypothetical protein n=1 Tax=Sinomonas sp. ASV322 TaxID=3041920 RepID=UPI0027DBE9C2|nr:hypothetical protein [Sinomonas sp. ASV322]MDQ4501209.1 hypothetical protein [Sinomonas sp. ASV322]